MMVTLFFDNAGYVMDMTPTPPREIGNVAEIDISEYVDHDVQVLWPVRFGMPGQSYAENFLLRLDGARALPMRAGIPDNWLDDPDAMDLVERHNRDVVQRFRNAVRCICNPDAPGDCRSYGCDPDCQEC